MQPVPLRVDIKARLIKVDYRGRPHSLLDLMLEFDQAFGTPITHVIDSTVAEPMTKQVFKQLPCPLLRKQLVAVKVADQSSNFGSVLHCVAHLSRKLPTTVLAALGTSFGLGTILSDLKSKGRQLKDLASFFAHTLSIGQRVATGSTLLGRQLMHLVWPLAQGQVVTWVALLTTRGPVTFGPLSFLTPPGFITRWGFAGVAAILPKLRFEFLDPLLQLAHLMGEGVDLGVLSFDQPTDGLRPQLIYGSDFIRCHGPVTLMQAGRLLYRPSLDRSTPHRLPLINIRNSSSHYNHDGRAE